MSVRSLIRAAVPPGIRLRRAVWLRRFRDRRDCVVFAERRAAPPGVAVCWSSYELPFIDYPGQASLAAAKRHSQRVLASYLDGVVIRPRETFSVWKCAGRPIQAKGYAEAAALKNGILLHETGGAICLLSTVLYNAGLLAGLEVVERHCHSVDSYGDARYFELGRDAAIEYGYLDLRFRNTHAQDLELRVEVTEATVAVSLWAAAPKQFEVRLVVGPTEDAGRHPCGWQTVRVRTRRVISGMNTVAIEEDLGYSTHRIPPG